MSRQTAHDCACRQAERDNLVVELVAALKGLLEPNNNVGRINAIEQAERVLARVKEQS